MFLLRLFTVNNKVARFAADKMYTECCFGLPVRVAAKGTDMRVSSSSSIGGGKVSPGRKAQLESQIKKLEKQKRRLQKKLRGESESSGKTSAPSLQNAMMMLGSGENKTTVPSGNSLAAVAGTSTAGDASVPAGVATPKTADPMLSAVSEVLSTFSGLQQSSGSGIEDMIEDPKEIMKQIMMLEQQIMMLKQQLGEEPKLDLDDDDSKPRVTLPGGETAVAESVESFSPPDVSVDGHVDGYA